MLSMCIAQRMPQVPQQVYVKTPVRLHHSLTVTVETLNMHAFLTASVCAVYCMLIGQYTPFYR